MSAELQDVTIVGAGPCGLAVAARLCEETPSALFTDIEHQRYHWIKRHRNRQNLVKTRGKARHEVVEKTPISSSPAQQFSMLVLDSTSDSWLAKWKSLFRAYGIKHLRSPLFFHPDPRDRNGLKEFAYSEHREKELTELTGVVGKETSKHQKKKSRARKHILQQHLREGMPIDQRDVQDYYTPSNSLFCDHCTSIASNYALLDSVTNAHVESIEYAAEGTREFPDVPHFIIETNVGRRYSRIVVLAIGPGSSPSLPRQLSTEEKEGACHTSAIPAQGCISSLLQERIALKKPTNVLVIGGGLTSSQICDLCIRKGVTLVWHIMRGSYKVKHFDVDLPWVAKYRNLEMAGFWNATDDEERYQKIIEARGGGSITPSFKAIESRHIAQNRLCLYTNTQLLEQTWDSTRKYWSIVTKPHIDNLPEFDHIYFATGAKADIGEVNLLKKLHAMRPIPTIQGLPCLTEDLQWDHDVPLFISGRFAGLRLGPGAANLEGARVGAERIAWKVQELLGTSLHPRDRTDGINKRDESSKVNEQINDWRLTYEENLRAGSAFSLLATE